MPETAQLTLPVLPLHNGVVFPHMVVTIRIETEEGQIASAAAAKAEGRLLSGPPSRGQIRRGRHHRRHPADGQ